MQKDNNKKSILYLHKYARKAAAYRHRFELFFPLIQQSDINVRQQSLLNDSYLNQIYENKGRPWINIIISYLQRFIFLFRQSPNVLKIVYMELFPRAPYFIESLFLRKNTYIIELDDAYFLSYYGSINRNKVPNLMKNAHAIIAGSHFLKDYACQWNHNVHLIPTVVNLIDYPRAKQHFNTGPVVIGWMGSHSTSKELLSLADSFRALEQSANVKFLFVGSPELNLGLSNIEYRKWQEDRVISDIFEMDIGIMPLEDNKWNQGKCGFKLIQYMAAGLPVVTSPVGENKFIVQNQQEGLYAKSTEDWTAALNQLVKSADLRQTMGEKARLKVEQHYSLEAVSKSYVELIENSF